MEVLFELLFESALFIKLKTARLLAFIAVVLLGFTLYSIVAWTPATTYKLFGFTLFTGIVWYVIQRYQTLKKEEGDRQ